LGGRRRAHPARGPPRGRAVSFTDWFEPARFFAEGYPKGVTSALRVFPEIGPGDRPLIGSVRGAVYLDLLPRFLRRAEGRGVVGDLREAPFKAGSFDL